MSKQRYEVCHGTHWMGDCPADSPEQAIAIIKEECADHIEALDLPSDWVWTAAPTNGWVPA